MKKFTNAKTDSEVVWFDLMRMVDGVEKCAGKFRFRYCSLFEFDVKALYEFCVKKRPTIVYDDFSVCFYKPIKIYGFDCEGFDFPLSIRRKKGAFRL